MRTYLLTLILASTLSCTGQITFEERFSDFPLLYSSAVMQVEDSGYVISGYGFGNEPDYHGCWLRTNKYGESIWQNLTGLEEDDYLYAGTKTSDYGFILTGDIYEEDEGKNVLLVKVDNEGEMQWAEDFGGVNSDFGKAIYQTGNNNFLITGYTSSMYGSNPQPYDFYVIKTNVDGELLWEKNIGGDEDEYAYSACPAANNSVIIAGSTSSYGPWGSNIFLVKLDNDGNVVWTKTYDNGDAARSIKPLTDGNYIVLAKYKPLSGMDQIVALKINENGDTLWCKNYSEVLGGRVKDCAPTNDGGYVITGNKYVGWLNVTDIMLLRADNNGNLLWSRYFGNSAAESGESVKQTYDGGFVITGGGSYSCQNPFITLVKTDSTGCVKPLIDSITGHRHVSIFDTIPYSCIDSRGAEYNWTSGYGEIVTGQGYDSVGIVWEQTGVDTLQVTVSNGCGIDTMCITITIDSCLPPLITPISGNTDVYLYDVEEYSVDLLEGKSPVTYAWNVKLGSILSGQNTPCITVEWNEEGYGIIEVEAINECGSHIQLIEGIYIIYSDVQEQVNTGISIFPNPSHGLLNINLPKHVDYGSIEIFDIKGELVFRQTITKARNRLNLSFLHQGLYLIKLKIEDEVKVGKLVINSLSSF
ncbi:MAG: T9SS type A sorting domain-containing protein [Bacteroidales bacterium]|nr:T9SS type A sorting domain-containing protein [Bacteroidales bacterium]